MSCSVQCSDFIYKSIPGSNNIITLTVPKGKINPKVDMTIVYLSKELFQEDGLYTVFPISLLNFDSCEFNGQIKEDKLLAVIQEENNNQKTIFMHKSHIPDCAIDLYLKLDEKRVLVLGSFSKDRISSLNDEQYSKIDAIYTTYLQATLAQLQK